MKYSLTLNDLLKHIKIYLFYSIISCEGRLIPRTGPAVGIMQLPKV